MLFIHIFQSWLFLFIFPYFSLLICIYRFDNLFTMYFFSHVFVYFSILFVSLLLQKYKLFSGLFFFICPSTPSVKFVADSTISLPYSLRFYHFTISDVLQWTLGSHICTFLGPLEPLHRSAERTNIPRSLHLSLPFLTTLLPGWAAVNQWPHCSSFSLETIRHNLYSTAVLLAQVHASPQ